MASGHSGLLGGRCERAILSGSTSPAGKPSMLRGSSAQASDVACIIHASFDALGILEYGSARDQHICAGCDHIFRGIAIDASIYLQHHVAAGGSNAFARGGDFRQLAFQEDLAAIAGIDRHDEDEIDEIED